MGKLFQWRDDRETPAILHPAIFISCAVLIGMLFALQEWMVWHRMGAHLGIQLFALVHGVDFFLWGSICWTMWALLGERIRRAGILSMVSAFVPLSILLSVGQEMLILLLIPQIPFNRQRMPYWSRFNLLIYGDFLNNMVIFWCAFFLFRSIDYYQRYRKHERTAARLETQLANAQLSALRMQLNPHFLFNAMNSISSLMRIDIEVADKMLEQLSCLMRITLERGDAQFIPLRDEMEFIEMYLAMQAQRYAGRVEQTLSVDPELYDALVPSMLLQPIVENAFVHGLSKINANGKLSVAVRREGTDMQLRVVNSGTGLKAPSGKNSSGHGVGLANIKDRLKLHYGEASSLSIVELDARRVQVTVRLPLQFSLPANELEGRFEAQ